MITSEFGAVEQYLGGVTQYQGLEKLANAFGWVIGKRKLGEDMRTERILKTTLSENIEMILGYYKSMKDVLYTTAIENQKAANAIKDVRGNTVKKLNEHDPLYNEWQGKRKTN